MEFYKYHSLGNDYILLDAREGSPFLAPEDIRMLCNRQMGIGADGLILIQPSNRAHCRMIDYNPDASEADVSGNGLRCVAKHLHEMGIIADREMEVETRSGLRTVKLQVALGRVQDIEVNLGKPDFRRQAIPMNGDGEEAVEEELELEDDLLKVTCLSMGTPHCVLFLDRLDDATLFRLGPALEYNPIFPLRVNVEFARVLDVSELMLRSWERGAGPTMSSAAGAAAVLAAAARTGRCKNLVQVLMPGGLMEAELTPGGDILSRASARRVFRGELDDDWRESGRIVLA
jgi:diaminopimelate epimerase